jgi:hypothetical protein
MINTLRKTSSTPTLSEASPCDAIFNRLGSPEPSEGHVVQAANVTVTAVPHDLGKPRRRDPPLPARIAQQAYNDPKPVTQGNDG